MLTIQFVLLQIVGSTLNDDHQPDTNFETEKPSGWFAELYKKHNLTGGHIIMLGPNNEEAALEALVAYPGGMQVGGGIKPGNAKKFLDAGASHVIVTSYVFRDGKIDYDEFCSLMRAGDPVCSGTGMRSSIRFSD